VAQKAGGGRNNDRIGPEGGVGPMSRPIITRFNNNNPCPVCESGSKGCSVTDDGLHLCRGEPKGDDWKMVKVGDTFRAYRHKDARNDRAKGNPLKTTGAVDWTASAHSHAQGYKQADKDALAQNLGLPIQDVQLVGGIGFALAAQKDQFREWVPAWTFPEVSTT
jgi:hypothetical protein